MTKILRAFLLSGVFAVAVTGNVRAADDHISFTMPQMYAEGIAYNSVSNEFLVSSLHYGIVGAIGMDGKYRQWERSGGERFLSSFGIKIDAPRGRVLVCMSDLGVSENSTATSKHKLAGVAIYDLMTGQLRGFIDLARILPGEHFANDLTVDQGGNIYVTDSFAPVIYKIDAHNYAASVLFNDPRFGGDGIKLNGIVAHPDGYLLAVRMDSGALFRLDLKSREITEVALPALFPGADGLLLDAANDLILVQNEPGIVRRLHSADGWRTASLIASSQTPLRFPTTATLVNGKVYVLEAKLPELFDANAQKSDQFNIVAVQFIDDPAIVEKRVKAEKALQAKKARKLRAKKLAGKRAFKETVVNQAPVVSEQSAPTAAPLLPDVAKQVESKIELAPPPLPDVPQAQPGVLIPVVPPSPMPEKQ